MKRLFRILLIWVATSSLEASAGKDECLSAFNAKDYELALQECQEPARNGEIWSQSTMAKLFYLGLGVTQDYQQAAHWFRLAAEQGGKSSQYFLGSMYFNGHGVATDRAEAIKWYLRSAEQGEILAQTELARLAGEEKNPVESFKWSLMAARQGVVDSQLIVGLSYLAGDGVEQNFQEGEQWMRRAAEAGNADARFMLGALLVDGDYVKQDQQEGLQWLRLAADQGNAQAKVALEKIAAAAPAANSPTKLSCEDGRNLKSTYTPLDLYPVMPDCMAKKLYQEAGDIYALAGVYGYFDRLRVRDKSAHQAASILAMTFGAKLPEDFREHLKSITMGEGLIQLCERVKKIGMPDYFPHYMVSHGVKSLQSSLTGTLPPSPLHEVNPLELWNHALDKYLHCPA